MTPRQRLNRFLETVAIPHLALYLVFGQIVVYVLVMARNDVFQAIPLVPARVLGGEWWRLFSYAFQPASFSIAGSGMFTNVLSWMMLYFVGTALEGHWGTVRFNLYVFSGWLLTAAVAFLVPFAGTTNFFFLHSIFLAFAFIAPELEMLVFFILPVKVKWLALAGWLMFALLFVQGNFAMRLAVAATVVNFILFFWRDITLKMRGGTRRMVQAQRTRAAAPEGPRHTCLICGKNSDTHPDLDFRYCSKCAGDPCYCPEHIRNHDHILQEPAEPPK